MAQIYTTKLTRSDPSCNWGFRLQGGKDFGTPLLIQKVNIGSLAEKAGLQVGDAVLKVSNKDLTNERHKDAQDAILRAGNSIELTVQRGGLGTWKPAVTPVGSIPSPNPYKAVSPTPVTKTSLRAANRQPSPRIPCGFNSPMKPFSPQLNGSSDNDVSAVKAIVNKQYNSPVGIYSDESIAETLSAQAEVLAGGVLGVNFKKNEKNYNAETSEVFKMVQEAESEPRSPEPERPLSATWPSYHAPSSTIGSHSTSRPHTPTTQTQPITSNYTRLQGTAGPDTSSSTVETTNCFECRQNIVGVFVRIKDKNLHVECFKCATCGTSLKNVGYYSINNKLYCDIHAKMVARQNPPATNLEPVTISPFQCGATKPFSSVSTNMKPQSPQPSTLTPVPFHSPRLSPTHVSPPVTHSQNNTTFNGTKTLKPNQPSTTPVFKPGFQVTQSRPFPKEYADPANSSSQFISYFNPAQKRLPFLKPRAEKSSAFMPVMKSTTNVRHTVYDSTASVTVGEIHEEKIVEQKLETVFENTDSKEEQKKLTENSFSDQKRQSVCSQEISRVLSENKCTRNLSTLVDHTRPESPAPSEFADEFSAFEHSKVDNCENRKLELSSATPHGVRSLSPYERPVTPGQVVVFPPEVPNYLRKSLRQLSTQVPSPTPLSQANSAENQLHPYKVMNTNEQNTSVSLQNDQPLEFEPGILTSCMTIAPTRPFTPIEPAPATIYKEAVSLPEETAPYLPTEKEKRSKTDRAPSPMLTALTVVSERSYSPLPTLVDYHELTETKYEEKARPSMTQALSVAPVRCYNSTKEHNNTETLKSEDNKACSSASETAKIPDLSDDPSVILTRPSLETNVPKKKDPPPTYYSSLYSSAALFPPICNELKAKFDRKKKTGSFSKKSIESVSREKTPDKERAIRTSPEDTCTPVHSSQRRPLLTDTGLHKPITLPHYQYCVKELVSRNTRKTPTASRRNTPTPSDKRSVSQTSTPTNFEATVCTQQKIFHSDLTSQLNRCSLQTSSTVSSTASSFLQQTTDISEKVAPVLGYQPCSLVERASFEKIERCVRNIREERLIERSVSPVDHKPVTMVSTSVSATTNITNYEGDSSHSSPESLITPMETSKTDLPNKAKRRSRSRSCRTPEQSCNIKPSPLAVTSLSDDSSAITMTASGAQCFKPSPSPITTTSSHSKSNTTAASLISRQLSKTVGALTSSDKISNSACSINNSYSDTSITPSNTTLQTGGPANSNLNYKNPGSGTSAGLSAPRRGKGTWNPQNKTPGARIPLCAHCDSQIRGPFITALGKIWCPEHFICVNQKCKRSLLDIGFVEEPTGLYCEFCFEQYLAPDCGKCNKKVKGDCLNAIGKHFHPECFTCAYCGKLFGNNPFFLEDGLPYCENDWNELFTTKCFACGFPIEAGDRWVEALNNNYHSPCFNCTICKTNLEGQSFYAKGGRPFCKNHSR